MSLMERVRKAGGDTAAGTTPLSSKRMRELKQRIELLIPSHTIAQMKAENQARAENEVRVACARVFTDDPWFVEDEQERSALIDALIDSMFGLGPLEWMIADESITEIMVNGSSSLYLERGGKLEAIKMSFDDDEAVRALIDRIIGPLGRRIDEASPMVNARLAGGHRVHAVIPPIAVDGPMLTIRKFTQHVITLEEMTASDSIEQRVSDFLKRNVHERKNIAVSGGTGSGKTTLLNALSCEIAHDERIVTIEDSAELRFFNHPHVVRLEARPPSAEGTGEITIRDLVINALRMRPDRIIVGEVRGGEALEMLTAMNTGHSGSLTTLHANSPADCLLRLTTMARYAADLPVDAIEAQIGTALDLIVQTERASDGKRFVSEIDHVTYDHDSRVCHIVPFYKRHQPGQPGDWFTLFGACSRNENAAECERKAMP